MEEAVANYGDVALNLPADWSRAKLNDKRGALMTVGHTDGVADAHLKEDPDKRHHFAWVDPRYRDDVDVNRTNGFKFVKDNEGWAKSENLWEWDAEHFCVCMGQRLMARPAEMYFAAQAEREQARMKKREREAAEALRAAERAGIDAELDGRKVRRRARG